MKLKKIIAFVSSLAIVINCIPHVTAEEYLSAADVLNANKDSIASISALTAEDMSETIYPQTVSNYRSSLRDNSYLTATDSGYMRVYYDDTKIGIENYDSDLNIISTRTIETELSIWGGFYKGNDAYYLVEGENNLDEDDNAEVIRVIKYDFDWNRQGAAKITGNPNLFGGEVRYPFDYGNVNMAEYDGTLCIVTGHQGYVDPDVGQGHQGFLMIAVDESTMEGGIASCDLWHSFAQYIRAEDSYIYVLEQSEGGRCTLLSMFNADSQKWDASFSVLDYGGYRTSSWAVACYASVDGLELSNNNVLGIGTSIDQSLYDDVTYDTSHNIYLTVTPKSDMSQEATTVKWLTDYKDDGMTFTNVMLTKINDNRFLVTWGEWDGEIHEATDTNDLFSGYTMHYVFIDENGEKLTDEYTESGLISDCQPIVNGSDVVFFTSNPGTLNFYTINANSGDLSKKIYRKVGDGATWDMTGDGTLTISGSGTIERYDGEYGLGSVSSVGGYSYYTGSVWAPIESKITTIEINEGITEIGEKAFYGFDYIDIYIPDSVTSIGEDALWSGWYSWNYEYHIVRMTIYCNTGSYAHQYTEENGIKYVLIDIGEHYTVGKSYIGSRSEDIRAGRNAESALLGTIPKNTVCWVTAISGSDSNMWGKVTYNGVTGYINLYYSATTDEHQWSDWTITKDATCTESGTQTRSCGCGESEEQTIAATGHSYGEWQTVKAATCTEDGTEQSTCSICGNSETRTIAAAGHTYKDETTAPTATEGGYTKHTCTVCGDSYIDSYTPKLGDPNNDSKITTVDAKWVLQYVSGSRTLTPEQIAAADVNGDGKITTVDAKWILQTVSGSRNLQSPQSLRKTIAYSEK